MPVEWIPTGNSLTKIAYDTSWRVLDVGSGHNPHPRADVLLEKSLSDNYERSGQQAAMHDQRPLVVGDACAMPFSDGAFDFAICSHVAEHVDDPHRFACELSRVSRAGYVETPSKLTKTMRPQPFHGWFVTARNGMLVFEKKPRSRLARMCQRLFFSAYFYKTNHQLDGKDVCAFAYGVRKPWHYALVLTRLGLVRLWLLLKPLTYTRFLYHHGRDWAVVQDQGAAPERMGPIS